MNTLRPVVLFAALALMASPLAFADDKVEGDLGQLQGTWTGLVGPEKNIPITAIFKGKGVTLKVNLPDGNEIELKGEVKLDESATPNKKLDWTKFTRPDGESIGDNSAIYKYDNKDTIIICSGGPGNDRPKEFKAADAGEQHPNLLTLKRKSD